MMRCTVVLPFGVHGGSEGWALTMLRHLPDVEVSALVLEDGPLVDDLRGLGVPTQVRPVGRRPVDILGAVPSVARVLGNHQPDVIWANGVKAAAVALPAARLRRLRTVWVKHDFSFDRYLARSLGRLADEVVGTSAALVRSSGRTDGTVVPPARPTLDVVDAAESRAWWQDRLGPLPERWAVTVGRLVPFKGVDVAIRAVAETDGWGLVVVGEDDRATPGEGARLQRLADDLGVADRVRFAGAVAEVGRRLAGFDACLVLTRRDEAGFGREGYSIVALEAAASGLPLIGAADSEEVARLSAELGAVVEPTDVAGVAVALQTVDDEVQRRAAARGPALAADHPDADGCARRFRQVLARAAGQSPRGSTT